MSLKAKCLLLAACAGAIFSVPASAQDHRHVIEIHRGYPHGYRPIIVPRERFYRGYPVIRHYGPAFGGFGYFYDDRAAWRFFGFTSWELAISARLNEEQMRAHEAAIVEATSSPVNEPIEWSDGPASGTVTTTREGHTNDGRPCREFQQQVTIAGASEKAYGTACEQADGSWQIVKQ
jgi:hypothetical protein